MENSASFNVFFQSIFFMSEEMFLQLHMLTFYLLFLNDEWHTEILERAQ